MTVKGRALIQRVAPVKTFDVKVRPINNFYRPQVKPISEGLKNITESLGNLVPALRQYGVARDKVEQVEQSDLAAAAWEKNKTGFREAVANGQIKEGANPYFIKQYLELDLKNKATAFKDKLFFEYGDQKLQNNTNQGAFEAFYNKTLNDFKDEQNLDGYDIVDLNDFFFNEAANIRNNLEQQHINGRITVIENNTKLAFKQNTFNIINNAQLSTLDEIKLDFDTTDIRPMEIKTSYMAGKLQQDLDKAIANGMDKTDANNIVYDVVKQAAVEAEDADLLKILDKIEMGTGGFMSQTSTGKDIIRSTKDEIIQRQADNLRIYNLNKNLLESQKQDVLNRGFLDLIDTKGGILKVTATDVDKFLAQEFTNETGEMLEVTPDDYTNFYSKRSAFVQAATTRENNIEVLKQLEVMVMDSPNDPELENTIVAAMRNGDLTYNTAEILIKDIDSYKVLETHPYMRSAEYAEIETFIDDIAKNIRGSEGSRIDIFAARELKNKLKVYSNNLLFDPKYYDGESPFGMSSTERKSKFRLNILTFNELVEYQAYQILSKAYPSQFGEAGREFTKKAELSNPFTSPPLN